MRPRQSIVESFSTFLQFEADRFSNWVTDPKLRRSMQTCLARFPQPETTENFWALYWYKVWQTQSAVLADTHLSAYLQETCYWAAQKTMVSLASPQYTLSDCFQMAIARLDKVLKGFNPKQGFSLKNYASATFSSLIKEMLRQHHQADICTDWALLRKISQKRFVESLQSLGLPSETITSYVLAWNCFKTIYVPTQATGTSKLPKPDHATWEAIAKLYNSDRWNQLPPPEPECSAEILEKWISACAKAARSYLYPTFTSINTPKPGQSGELLDDLPGNLQESLLTEIIAQEEEQHRHAQHTQINTVLVAALVKLDPQAQRLLHLYYGQALTQQQIANQLDLKQYMVSRQLTRSRESLLLALARWSQETMYISLTSDLLKNINTVLEVWLQSHYNRVELGSSLEQPS